MGTWGPGLYANDFAEDFQAAIRAVLRLPMDPEQLVELLRTTYADVADHPSDEDHTAFWLVLADKFHKQGIECPDLYRRASSIIADGDDLKMLASLGMSESDLRKRQKNLEKLQTQLSQPLSGKARKTLQEPEPFLMNAGDLMVYPVGSDGEAPNPYMSQQMIADHWKHAGWGAMIILECGRAFDYLTWYRPVVLMQARPVSARPDLESLLAESQWRMGLPGTCSKSHHKKMQLECVGRVDLPPAKSAKLLAGLEDGNEYAINDISIANSATIGDPKYHSAVKGLTPLRH